MNKFRLLTCILICIVGGVYGQDYYTSEDFKIKLSKPFPVVDADTKLYLNSKEKVVSFKIVKTNNFVIQSFDPKTLDEVSRAETSLKEKYAEFEMFVRIGTRFYIFYTLYDKPNEIENLWAQEIDPNTSKFTGEPKNILSVKGKVVGVLSGGWSFRVNEKFQFESSKSDNKLLIHFRMKPEFRNDDISYDRVGLYVFDPNLNQLWGDIREMKYTEAQMDLVDYAVDDDGNAYILGKIYKDGNKDQKRRGDEEINYKYELVTLRGSNEIADYKPIELDDNKFIEAASLQEQDDNNLIIAGYYRNNRSRQTDGAFVFILNKTTGEYNKNYFEIPLDVLNAYEKKRTVNKNTRNEENENKGAGFAHLYLRDIIVDSEGNITLIGEQYHIERTYTSKGYSNPRYYYDDILATKVTAAGKLAWMIKIPKKQMGAKGRSGMSYAKLATDNFLYVMYLDNVKNYDLPIDQEPKQHIDGQGGFLTSTKINYETGAVSKENLFDLRDVEGIEAFQFATGRIINLTDDEIAVEVYKKKKEDIWIIVGLN